MINLDDYVVLDEYTRTEKARKEQQYDRVLSDIWTCGKTERENGL